MKNHEHDTKHTIHKINDSCGNKSQTLMENEKPSVRIIRHSDQNTFTTITKSEVKLSETFKIKPGGSATSTKITKLFLKAPQSTGNVDSATKKTTKAIVKSIHTYKYDPYKFNDLRVQKISSKKMNGNIEIISNHASATPEAQTNHVAIVDAKKLKREEQSIKNTIDANQKCDETKITGDSVSAGLKYDLINDAAVKESIASQTGDKQIDDIQKLNKISYIRDDIGIDDEEMLQSVTMPVNKSLQDNSVKTFVMHDYDDNDQIKALDNEKENNGPIHDNLLQTATISPYELLLQQQNVKSINLNLSPAHAIATVKSTPSTAAAAAVGGVSLPTSHSKKGTTNIQLSPIRPKTEINREKVREFMRKQQEQRKLEENAKKSQNEKQIIRARLEALKKTTRNLVKTNVEKKLKQQESRPNIHSREELKSSEAKHDLKKPAKMQKPGVNVSHESNKKSMKSIKSPLKFHSDLDKQVVTFGQSEKFDQLSSLGLHRKSDELLSEDLYSPIKIHEATFVQPVKSKELSFMQNIDQTNNFDVTLDPNANSFMIQENQSIGESPEFPFSTQKLTETKTEVISKKECIETVPNWLHETHVQQYPYNFITALRKKLSAALLESDTKKKSNNAQPAFINEKREYESCSFTEVTTNTDQHSSNKVSTKTINPNLAVNKDVGVISFNEEIKNSPAVVSMDESFTTASSISSQPQHTVSDPNTISGVSSLKSETIGNNQNNNNNRCNNEQRQVEGINILQIATTITPPHTANRDIHLDNHLHHRHRQSNQKHKINPQFDLIHNYAFDNEKHTTENDNEILLSTTNKMVHHEIVQHQQQSKSQANEDDSDTTYHALLHEFKQSLNNFIELNQKLRSVVKTKKNLRIEKDPKQSENVNSKIVDPISTTVEMDVETPVSRSSNKDVKNISSTKYSSTFEKENFDNQSSDTSTNQHEGSYTPRDFERSMQDTAEKSESKSLEESVVESKSLTLPSDEKQSVSPIKSDPHSFKSETVSGNYDHSESNNEVSVDPKVILDPIQQTVSIFEEDVTVSVTTSNSLTTESEKSNKLPTQSISEAKTGTIESLPSNSDDKYGSDFETENTDSMVESSVLEMSFNESNLNYSYSTVGMMDQMIYSESMKNEQISAMIGVKTKSIIDRLKGQISFLEIKKRRCKGSGQNTQAQSIKKKQRAILMKLEQAKDSLKKIVQAENRGVLQSIQQKNTNRSHYVDVFEKLLHSHMKIKSSTATVKKHLQPVRGYEMEPSLALEKILEQRQHDLQERRHKLEHLSKWQAELDLEEQKIIEMENDLLQQNIGTKRQDTFIFARKTNAAGDLSQSSNERQLKLHAIEDKNQENKENISDESVQKLSQIESSLSILQDVIDGDEAVALTGVKLNKLWYRLCGQKEKKFDPERVYEMDKKQVEALYEEAKNKVLNQFQDKNRIKQLLEVSKLQDTVSETVPEDRNESQESIEVNMKYFEETVKQEQESHASDFKNESLSNIEEDLTLTEENLEEKEVSNIPEQTSSPTNVLENSVPDAESTKNEPGLSVSENLNEFSYSDTFNDTGHSQVQESILEDVSFPKFDDTDLHNGTFVEKSEEMGSSSKEDEDYESNDTEKGTSSNEVSSDISEAVDASVKSSTSSSELQRTKTAIGVIARPTAKISPEQGAIRKFSPSVGAHIEYKLPDIINEAEVLRRQQMQIEQEIEQLQQQVPLIYLKNIPNKPPPPYTLPVQESKDKFPSVDIIQKLVYHRVEQLYKSSRKYSLLNGDKPENEKTYSIYERLIIDVSEELFNTFEKCTAAEKQTGIIKNSLVFYNPPNELQCLQNFISRKVKKICEPLCHPDKTSHLNDFNLASSTVYYSSRRHKKDLVDDILMQELTEDDANWTYFEEEEIIVKKDLVNSILKMLVQEAVTDILHIVS